MPRFSAEVIQALKRKLLTKKAAHYVLETEEVADLMETTGLTEEQFRLWTKNLHLYYPTLEAKEKFLLDSKVILSFQSL
jgi:heme oxygenase